MRDTVIETLLASSHVQTKEIPTLNPYPEFQLSNSNEQALWETACVIQCTDVMDVVKHIITPDSGVAAGGHQVLLGCKEEAALASTLTSSAMDEEVTLAHQVKAVLDSNLSGVANVLSQGENEQEGVFLCDLGDIYRQHVKWSQEMPNVQPFYGELNLLVGRST
jgi:hypothetical protein